MDSDDNILRAYEKLKIANTFKEIIDSYGVEDLIDTLCDDLIETKNWYLLDKYMGDEAMEYFRENINGENTVIEYLDTETINGRTYDIENHYKYKKDKYGYKVLQLVKKNYAREIK